MVSHLHAPVEVGKSGSESHPQSPMLAHHAKKWEMIARGNDLVTRAATEPISRAPSVVVVHAEMIKRMPLPSCRSIAHRIASGQKAPFQWTGKSMDAFAFPPSSKGGTMDLDMLATTVVSVDRNVLGSRLFTSLLSQKRGQSTSRETSTVAASSTLVQSPGYVRSCNEAYATVQQRTVHARDITLRRDSPRPTGEPPDDARFTLEYNMYMLILKCFRRRGRPFCQVHFNVWPYGFHFNMELICKCCSIYKLYGC